MSMPQNDRVTRREFLQSTGYGAVAVGAADLTPKKKTDKAEPDKNKLQKSKLPYGTLGRTKYPVTLISFGAILISGKLGTRIVKRAIDKGVNLVHTAANYQGGKSIQACGELFKTEKSYRDKVFLCIKAYHPNKESEIDDLLKILHTDHAEVAMTELHKADPKRLEAIMARQGKLKMKGKLGHTGFVCHGDMNGVLEMVLDKAPKFFDVALLAMKMVPAPGNDKGRADEESKRFAKNLKALRKNGLGILSMKTGARKAVTKDDKIFQAHAKAILEGGADSVLTSMNTYQQVDMVGKLDLKNPHLSPTERKTAMEFQRSLDDDCLMCGNCTKVCPRGVPVGDLMRVRLYHDGYGWPDHARAEFDTLNVDAAGLNAVCQDCSICSAACPINLANPNTIKQVAGYFG